MKNPGVLICGAYGMGNAGDDAVLRSILAALREYDGSLPIRVMARKPRETARAFGVEAVHPLNVPRWLRLMKRSGLFISGGGSLLQDVTSRRSLWYYLAAIALAKKQGCAVMLYGCGIGPVGSEANRERCARVLNACADRLCLRDAASAQSLADWGVTADMLVTADPAFRGKAAGGEREKCIGFALRGWEGFWYRVPYFAAAARHAWERYGLTPVFVCMAPEDIRAAKSVMAALGDVPCRMMSDPKGLGRMSVVLSMRLHGLIFALAGGASPAGVSYDPKVAAFCEENGLPWERLETATEERLCALIDRAAASDPELLAETAEKLRRRERQNAAAAWELLSRGDGG